MKKSILFSFILVAAFSLSGIAGETPESENAVIEGCSINYTPGEMLYLLGIMERTRVEGVDITMLYDDGPTTLRDLCEQSYEACKAQCRADNPGFSKSLSRWHCYLGCYAGYLVCMQPYVE